MARQGDNNIPPPQPQFRYATINLTKYGEGMTITGKPNNRWSFRDGDDNMRYIHADSVEDFTVSGQLPMSSLAPRRKYRGVFELELTSHASGWQGDFEASLDVPGARRAVKARSSKHDKIGEFKLKSRSFELTAPQRSASIGFSLSHTGSCPRKGLTVKRFVIKEA